MTADAGTTGGHYFEPSPTIPSDPHLVTLALPDFTASLHSDRGVFAADAVDVGTRYLLLEAPAVDSSVATVLDLGCGYGPIARTLAERAPAATVFAIDVNERARSLCARNLEGFDAVVAHPDDVDPAVRFDLIWSNPPIRIGKAALHELLSTWLARLAVSGSAVLVVRKHLGADSLERWLAVEGYPVDRVGARHGYRLLQVGPR